MDVESITPDKYLDTKGLSCPMPLLKTKKAIDAISPGEILEIAGTDPGSKNDLPNWCQRSGHTFLGNKEDNGIFNFFIQKG